MEKIPILVLDDDPDITLLTRSTLTMHGYQVTEFNNPLEALKALEEQEFELILADLMMPEMDGVQFIRTVQERQPESGTRYAVLTAKKLDEGQRREIYDLQAEIMTKPFIPMQLAEKVAEILR